MWIKGIKNCSYNHCDAANYFIHGKVNRCIAGNQDVLLYNHLSSKCIFCRDPHGLKNTGAFEQDVFLTMSDEGAVLLA